MDCVKSVDEREADQRTISAEKKVVPKLREIFLTSKASEKDSAIEAGLMILLENMQIVAENCSGKEFRDDILPILHLSLESPTHALVDASLTTLPHVLPVLDFRVVVVAVVIMGLAAARWRPWIISPGWTSLPANSFTSSKLRVIERMIEKNRFLILKLQYRSINFYNTSNLDHHKVITIVYAMLCSSMKFI